MLLKIAHQTDLTYSEMISESAIELRMAPRQGQDQHRLSFNLAIGPAATVGSYFDWLDNTVHAFTVNGLHNQIRIIATSIVETDRPRKEPERFADKWPIPTTAYDFHVFDYLQFGGPVINAPELHNLVQLLQPQEGASLGELALRILHLIDEKFSYQQGITTAASPISEMLEHGKGVCQDFTHMMIALARAMKIPARYVSGLLHPEAQRFRGYTQTHAWCELLFPSAGWVGFDPTNRCVVGGNFVKVGVGRDFRDVPPNKGLYRGSAIEAIDVQVTSEELPWIPPELAAERVQSLDIPVYEAVPDGKPKIANQQAEQQQQEQQQQ